MGKFGKKTKKLERNSHLGTWDEDMWTSIASIAEPKLFVSGSFGSRAVAGARVAPSPAGTCVYHKVF